MNDQTETEAALAAMNRAAEAARVRASRFGSHLAFWKDGAVVLVDPRINGAEQGDARRPATAADAKTGGDTKPKPESERRSQ